MVRAVLQRVDRASLKVDGKFVGKIERGIVALICFVRGDGTKELDWLVSKILNLRIFEDEQGKMNLSVKDVGGKILAVSQFTLAADVKKGTRPSFSNAMNPDEARKMWDEFKLKISQEVECVFGEFGAHMEIELVNNGPVTIWLDRQF